MSENKNRQAPKHHHNGHRDRLRKRFERAGLKDFEKHEILELLLFYCIPRRDTNEIAHELLDKFNNSLAAVFRASVNELMEVNYITYNSAILIKMIPDLMDAYVDECNSPGDYIHSSEAAMNYFKGKLMMADIEKLMVAYLDNSNRIICCDIVSEGTVNAAKVDLNKIIMGAARNRASVCILAHNHPNGSFIPSDEDRRSTREVSEMLWSIGVRLVDHIIVGEGGRTLSMAESHKYSELFSPFSRK